MQAEVKERKGKEGIVINLILNKSEFVLICVDEACWKRMHSLVVDWPSVDGKGECFEVML